VSWDGALTGNPREVVSLGGHLMRNRFEDVGQTIYQFGDEFLVRCPRCGQRAYVIRLFPPGSDTFAFRQVFDPRRCVCPRCGYIQEWHKKGICIGDAIDWYFHLPLWLQTPCCGHVLWAYNAAHLAFLECYVQATLRERLPNPNTNRSLASRLPLWIKYAANRKDVLKGIARLKSMQE
jgi:ribosomal protein L37E